MAGWDAYPKQAVDSKNFNKAAVLSAEGDQWGQFGGFALQGTEGKGLKELFKTPQNAFTVGIFVGGVKYLAIKADGNSIYGKKG